MFKKFLIYRITYAYVEHQKNVSVQSKKVKIDTNINESES